MEDTVTQQLFTAPVSPEETNSSSYCYPYSLSPHQPVTDTNPTATSKATTFTLPLRTNSITMSSTNSDKVSDSLSLPSSPLLYSLKDIFRGLDNKDERGEEESIRQMTVVDEDTQFLDSEG